MTGMQVTIHDHLIVTSDAQVGAPRARLAEYVRQLDAAFPTHLHRPRDTHTNSFVDPAGYAGDYSSC